MGKWSLSEGFEAYQIENKFYVPLSEMVAGFEFPIQVNAEEGTAIGWFISEDRKFKLDLNEGSARSNTQTISLSSESVLWGEEDIYVETSILDKFFPVETKVDSLSLILNIKGLEPMPFEEKIEREKRRKMLETNQFKNPVFTDPFIENNAWFTVPFLDFALSMDHREQQEDEETSATYSLSGNGILFGLDSSFNFYGASNSENRYGRLKVSRYMPVNKIKYFEAGDISGYNMSLISAGSSGRGFNLSTFNEKGNAVDRHFFLSGLLTQGWDVELYQNNVLKDFSKGDGAGEYRFDEIPLELGMNKLKLVFYGEQGERREEEKTIYLSATSVGEGEFGFRLYAQEKGMPLIPLNHQKIIGKEVGFYGEYGVLQQLSFTLGGVLFKPTDDINEARIYDETLGMLGIKTGFSIFRIALSTAYSENSEAPAFEGILESNLGDYNLYLEQNDFNGIHSAKSFLDNEFVESISRVHFRGRLPIPFMGSLPFLSKYTRALNEEDDVYQEFSNMLSLSWWRFYLSLESKCKQKFSGAKENLGITNLNFRSGRFAIRGVGRYDLNNNYLQNTSVGIDWQTQKRLLFQSNWIRSNSLDGSEVDSYSFSISRPFKFGTLSAGVSTNLEDSQTFKISYNASILNNPSTGEIFLGEPGQSQKAAFSARSYLDSDYDNSFSEEDTILQNIRYKATNVQAGKESENDYVFITGVSPYQLTNIQVETESMDDISYYPKEKSFTVLPRTGTVTPVDFAVLELGSIDGEVMLKKNEAMQPLSGMQLILLFEGKEIDKTITDTDGYYTFEKLKPGGYEIKIDTTQIEMLNYKNIDGKVFTLDKEDLYKTIQTFLIEKE